MSWYSEPQDKVKIGVVTPTPSTRKMETEQTEPVIEAHRDHVDVYSGKDTELTFSYIANTAVDIQLKRDNDRQHSVEGQRAGNVSVPIVNAKHEHHHGNFQMTIRDSIGRTATASTFVHVHVYKYM